MAGIMAVSNETKASTSRVTKEGRHLTYEMEVIQQPERARACGSGAKCTSSAPLCSLLQLTFISVCGPTPGRPTARRSAAYIRGRVEE